MDIRILLKNKKLDREEDITVYLEVSVMGCCLLRRDSQMKPFGFSRDVIGSTRRPTIVNKLAVIVLQDIMTHLFVSLDMFSLVVTYLFAV